METMLGGSSRLARVMERWQCGHAVSRQTWPRTSSARPSTVKRVGRNRRPTSPRRSSPLRSGCTEIQSVSSGGNPCQQCGQVTLERSFVPVAGSSVTVDTLGFPEESGLCVVVLSDIPGKRGVFGNQDKQFLKRLSGFGLWHNFCDASLFRIKT